MDEWSKSQNISLEQTDRTEPPPPPQAHTEQVNAVFTRNEKSDDSPKTQKDPPPPIIVKDKPIKTSKKECFELCGCVRWKPSRDYNSSTQDSEGFKGLLHAMCTYGLCHLFWNIGIGLKLYEWASNLVAPELVLDHHLIYRQSRMIRGEINPYVIMYLQHSLLVLRSSMYPKSKKNMLDEEEVVCQP
ncbi:hypothetical protein Tco_0254922 [Tanacetum coccineum]